MIYLIPDNARSQQWQSVISIDSRVGFTSNTYLNPFFGEWNDSLDTGYNSTSVFGHTFWYKHKTSLELTGGLVFEPFFENVDSWKGGIGLLNLQHRISNGVSVGVEGGGSYFTSSYNRTLAWAQPKLTWFMSPFSLLRIKSGIHYRSYENFAGVEESSDGFGLYAVEFETWPGFNWQLTAGIYGQLETLPAVQEGFSSRASAGYLFQNGASLRLNFGLEQYQQDFTSTTDGGGGPGLPFGGPSSGGGTQTTTLTDRIWRVGLTAEYPISERFAIFMSAEGLNFDSSVSETVSDDVQLSGGIRFSFEPRIRRGGEVTPQWDHNQSEQIIHVRYNGEGRLYLIGDFNDWRKPGIPMNEQSKNRYVAKLDLQTGAYEFKILLVRGSTEKWIDFSDETYTVDDGFGGQNALLLVEQ